MKSFHSLMTSLSLSLLLFSLSSFCMDEGETVVSESTRPFVTLSIPFEGVSSIPSDPYDSSGWILRTKNSRIAKEIVAIRKKANQITDKEYKRKNVSMAEMTRPYCTVGTYIAHSPEKTQVSLQEQFYLTEECPKLAFSVRKRCPDSMRALVCVLDRPEGIRKARQLLDSLENPEIMPSGLKVFFDGEGDSVPNFLADHAISVNITD